LRREAAREFAVCRPGGIQVSVVLVFLALVLLCGCSTFNRDWRQAAHQPAAPDSIEGRWEGSWISDVNGHNGQLRCLLTHEEASRYRARFRATYWKVFRFTYAVPLEFHAHDTGWEFNGEANLGWLAGGVYYYEGRATLTNLHATYKSKHDHGRFEMRRPE
jgi:hypothetical protein